MMRRPLFLVWFLYHSIRQHRIGDFDEASDVGSAFVVDRLSFACAVFDAFLMDVLHDADEALVDFLVGSS